MARAKSDDHDSMRWTGFLFWALFSGCAAAPSVTRAPSTSIEPTATEEEPAVLVRPARSKVWGLLDEKADVFAYVDAQRFITSPAFRGLLESVRLVLSLQSDPSDPSDALAVMRSHCEFDPLMAVNEIAYVADANKSNAVAVVALAVTAEQALACLQEFDLTLQEVKIADQEGLGNPAYAIVPQGDLLFVGSPDALGELLAAPRVPTGSPPAEDYLLVAARPDIGIGARRIEFAMGPAAAGTRLRFAADVDSPEAAASLEEVFRGGLRVLPERIEEAPVELQGALADMIRNLVITNEGDVLRATLTVEDGVLGGMLTALGAYGVKRHLATARESDAHQTLQEISERLRVYASSHRPQRFPRSAPRVPAVVPAADRYTSTPTDWKHPSWSAIAFSLHAPQYYSYEYETSKDGRKATVRARGDLDGDGIQSLAELYLVIDAQGQATVEPDLHVENPNE